MADRPKKKQQSGVRNDARKNGKAPKKNPKLTLPKSRTPEEIEAQQRKHAEKQHEIEQRRLRAEHEAWERAELAKQKEAEKTARLQRELDAANRLKAAREASSKMFKSLRSHAG
jgi:hypothetical protein